MNIQEIRAKYPQYNDLSDKELVDGFHKKFYSDIPAEEFYSKVGLEQKPQIDTSEAAGGLEQGMIDPVNGLAQLLSRIVPEDVRNNVNKFNDWLVDQGIPLQRMGEGGLDENLKKQEEVYQARRAEEGESGFDGDRLVGNVVSPANLAIASKIPVAKTLAGRVGTGTVAGAGFGASAPVTDGDYWEEKAKQASLGAVTGGALPVVTGAAARVIQPKLNKAAELLRKEGVPLTPGQMGNSFTKAVEEKARSLPLTGDAIARAHKQGITGLNTAALNRALEPIGIKLPKGLKSGRAANEYVHRKLSKRYEEILPKLTGVADRKLQTDIAKILDMGKSLPDAQESQLKKLINHDLINRFTPGGRINGETLKRIESNFGRKATGYIKANDPDQRDLGKALFEVQNSLRQMVARHNPDYADELQKINKGYSIYSILRDATSRTGAHNGEFSVSNLRAAARKADNSVGKAQTSEGKARLQDLADAADQILAQSVPDSGTAARVLQGGVGYAIDPSILIGLGAGSVPYMLNSTANKLSAPTANAIRQATPYATPGAVSLSDLLFNE